MSGAYQILRWVHDNIVLIYLSMIIAIFGVAWLAFEAIRSHNSRDQIFRLRQRLYQLERDHQSSASLEGGSTVLTSRWVNVGSAATTSDGGCLILLQAASPFQKRAMMSVRIDGLSAINNQTVMVGERLEVDGKSGIYSIELHGTEPKQARLAVALRIRTHQA
jgi:hypothetical protein